MTLVLLRWNTGPSGADCLCSRSQLGAILQGCGSPVQGMPLQNSSPASPPSLLSQPSFPLLHLPCPAAAALGGVAEAKLVCSWQELQRPSGTRGGSWPHWWQCCRVTCSSETLWVSKGFRALQLPALPGHVPHRSVATLPGLQCSGQLCLLLHLIPASETL